MLLSTHDKHGNLKPNLEGVLDEDGDYLWTDSEGRWHREDGPAIIWEDGEEEYNIRDKELSKEEWLQWLKDGRSGLDQKTVLRLILENS
jgi:hypothetical protein